MCGVVKGSENKKSSAPYSIRKWFLLGFGVRVIFAVVVTLIALTNFEATMLYLADLPTFLIIILAEEFLPDSLFRILVGGDPFYIPMNLVGGLLWGGIFMLVPLTRNAVLRSKRRVTTA